jgi:hypothetical protein
LPSRRLRKSVTVTNKHVTENFAPDAIELVRVCFRAPLAVWTNQRARPRSRLNNPRSFAEQIHLAVVTAATLKPLWAAMVTVLLDVVLLS